jgi:hypothetical protein
MDYVTSNWPGTQLLSTTSQFSHPSIPVLSLAFQKLGIVVMLEKECPQCKTLSVRDIVASEEPVFIPVGEFFSSDLGLGASMVRRCVPRSKTDRHSTGSPTGFQCDLSSMSYPIRSAASPIVITLTGVRVVY